MTTPAAFKKSRWPMIAVASLVAGAVVAAPTASAADSAPGQGASSTTTLSRMAGPDRYGTAADISGHHHDNGSDVVYVASGERFPDALAGSAVAGRDGAPVLLVRRDVVPEDTRAELERLDPDTIAVLGETAAVSQAVEAELAEFAPVERLGGADRYETAVEISQDRFPDGAETVYVASGQDYPDALAAAAVAAQQDAPVLLTIPDKIPTDVLSEVERLDPDTVVVLGGPFAVEPEVVADLAEVAGTVERRFGADRFETAAAFAAGTVEACSVDQVYIATGLDFPDALTGSAAAGFVGAPVLLTHPGSLPDVTRAELERINAGRINVLGGTAAVAQEVEDELAAISAAADCSVPAPPVNAAPVIAGASDTTITAGDAFDPMAGVTATDREDGDLTGEIMVDGTVDASVPGEYRLTYSVEDSAGAQTTAGRTVTVVVAQTPAPGGGIFALTLDTNAPGCMDSTIELPVTGVQYGTVDWGDGTTGVLTNGAEHIYAADGEYQVRVQGEFTGVSMYAYDDAECWLSVDEWGETGTTNLRYAFNGASNLTHVAGIPSTVTDVVAAFHNASSFESDVSNWDVSSISDFGWLFDGAESFTGQGTERWDLSSATSLQNAFLDSSFNVDVRNWDVSRVRNMEAAFAGTPFTGQGVEHWDVGNVENFLLTLTDTPFVGDVSGWDTSSAVNMDGMLAGTPFNGDVSRWDVSRVEDMNQLFAETPFNGDVSRWDVGNVEDFTYMFWKTPFTGDVSQWDTSSARTLEGMFSNTPFSGDISQWDVSSVSDLAYFAAETSAFDADLSQWDTSSVERLDGAFYDARAFTGKGLERWDTSALTDMHWAFNSAPLFDADLSGWDVSKVVDHGFYDHDAFAWRDEHKPKFA